MFNYKIIHFPSKVSKTKLKRRSGMLSEVGNNRNALCYAASCVPEFLLGGPPRLRSDAEAWSVSLNDNKASSPAAGQEEEDVFFCQNQSRHTHSRHEDGTLFYLRAASRETV